MTTMMKKRLLAWLWLVLAAAGVSAQSSTGNVLGTVTDSSGAVLPGATVEISGEAGSRTTVSGADGAYRFLNMDYGTYKVTVSLQGFGSATKSVTIVTGANATINVALSVGGKTESVEVSGEAPLVDATKRGTGSTITNEQLKDVPNSRDPWGIMRNVPGAMIDRVNIAGNENGQQASVAGKGSTAGDRVWTLDGLVITDMSATGASPSYFDFDAFQEINVSTGGNDLSQQTGGFGLGLVTKRGTNTLHGGARYISTDDRWSSSNISPELLADINKGGTANRLQPSFGYCDPGGGKARDKADHIDRIKDFGFDIGGPIVKDKLWFYATYGKQDIKLCRLNGTQDATLLPSYNAKLNWQASPSTMVSAYYFVGKKEKEGRGVGFFPAESDSFLWNQADVSTEGGVPEGLWKLEVNHTFSANLFGSVKAAYYDTGFGLTPRGGDATGYTLDFDAATAYGSYQDYKGRRPQTTASADGSYFFQGLGGNNQLKFGFGYRVATTNDTTHYSGNGLGGVISGGPYAAYVHRDATPKNEGRYLHAYVGDVLTKDRLSVNFGVRFDRQTATNSATSVAANRSFPTLAPAVNFAGSPGNVIEFNDVSPRAGFSYALTESRKTVVRGSYANYAAQLSYGWAALEAIPSSYLAYGWSDINGDKLPQPNEVDVAGGVLYSYQINPLNRSAIAGRVDVNLKNQRDNEFVLGLDHELVPNLAVGAAFTYRKSNNFTYTPWLAAACPVGTANCRIVETSQYVRQTPITQRGYTATYYDTPAAVLGTHQGRYRTNLPGYTRQFKGFEFTLKKRMSGRWASNVAFSMNDWTEDYGSVRANLLGNPTPLETAPLIDGGPVSIISGGSGKASFYSSFKWQVYADALLSLPASFSFSTALFGRQGGVFPKNRTFNPLGADGLNRVLAGGTVDAERYANLWNLDFRLARNSKIGRATLTPSVELFNALNNDVVLSRARNINASSLGRVEEVISPRILRVGVRLAF
jgi:hypothetical protein